MKKRLKYRIVQRGAFDFQIQQKILWFWWTLREYENLEKLNFTSFELAEAQLRRIKKRESYPIVVREYAE